MIAKLHQQHQAQMTMKIPLKKLSKKIYEKKIKENHFSTSFEILL